MKTVYWRYINNQFKEKLVYIIPELLDVTFLSLFTVYFLPGYFINLFIIVKEMTMWQFATSPETDFQPLGDKITEYWIEIGQIFGCDPDLYTYIPKL